ncbi:MAG: hypothetical protein H7210_02955 [Pyrinomonadaceae bacterium]|nr:hypothetical protein [Phycisphaerales bacterium]
MSRKGPANSRRPLLATTCLGLVAGVLWLITMSLNGSLYGAVAMFVVPIAFGCVAFHYRRWFFVFLGSLFVSTCMALTAGIFTFWSGGGGGAGPGSTLGVVDEVFLTIYAIELFGNFFNVLTGLFGFALGAGFGKNRYKRSPEPLVTCCLTCTRTRPGDLTESCPECGWVLKPNCGVCGYLRDGLASDLCPECGSPWQREPAKPPRDTLP